MGMENGFLCLPARHWFARLCMNRTLYRLRLLPRSLVVESARIGYDTTTYVNIFFEKRGAQ